MTFTVPVQVSLRLGDDRKLLRLRRACARGGRARSNEKNTAPGVFTLWGSSPNTSTNTTLTAPPPGLGAGEFITRVRWLYGQAAPGASATTIPRITGRVGHHPGQHRRFRHDGHVRSRRRCRSAAPTPSESTTVSDNESRTTSTPARWDRSCVDADDDPSTRLARDAVASVLPAASSSGRAQVDDDAELPPDSPGAGSGWP